MKKFLPFPLILLISVCGPTSICATPIYTVDEVIDGDTLKFTNGVTVHLKGIDAPENKPSEKAKSDSKKIGRSLLTMTWLGRKSARFLKKESMEDIWAVSDDDSNDHDPLAEKKYILQSASIINRSVTLGFDAEKRDQDGEVFAYVYNCYPLSISDGKVQYKKLFPYPYFVEVDGQYCYMVNAKMVYEGYAIPDDLAHNLKYADLFQELYREAREKKRGLWKYEDKKKTGK